MPMLNPLQAIVLIPCLVGLLPILCARSWPARRISILIGTVVLTFSATFAYELGPNQFRSPEVSIIGMLSTAFISIVVTFLVDR